MVQLPPIPFHLLWTFFQTLLPFSPPTFKTIEKEENGLLLLFLCCSVFVRVAEGNAAVMGTVAGNSKLPVYRLGLVVVCNKATTHPNGAMCNVSTTVCNLSLNWRTGTNVRSHEGALSKGRDTSAPDRSPAPGGGRFICQPNNVNKRAGATRKSIYKMRFLSFVCGELFDCQNS